MGLAAYKQLNKWLTDSDRRGKDNDTTELEKSSFFGK